MSNVSSTNETGKDESEQHQSYDPRHFAPLFDAEDRHFWFRTRNDVISTLTRQIVSRFDEGYRVLEVGCGTGSVLRNLELACRPGSVIGMDLFMEGLVFARKRTTAGLIQADIYHPPFTTLFDMICIFDVVEHIEDDARSVASLYKMLKPGGVLFVTVPAHMSLWSYFDVAACHCRRYEVQGLRSLLQQSGLEVEYITEFMGPLYPLVKVGRTLMQLKSRRALTDVETAHKMSNDELKVTPIINELLTLLLKSELANLSKRRILKRGTSILAVANRPMDVNSPQSRMHTS